MSSLTKEWTRSPGFGRAQLFEKGAPLSGEAARPLGYDFSDDKENLIDLLLDDDRGWITLFLAFNSKFTGV